MALDFLLNLFLLLCFQFPHQVHGLTICPGAQAKSSAFVTLPPALLPAAPSPENPIAS